MAGTGRAAPGEEAARRRPAAPPERRPVDWYPPVDVRLQPRRRLLRIVLLPVRTAPRRRRQGRSRHPAQRRRQRHKRPTPAAVRRAVPTVRRRPQLLPQLRPLNHTQPRAPPAPPRRPTRTRPSWPNAGTSSRPRRTRSSSDDSSRRPRTSSSSTPASSGWASGSIGPAWRP